MEVKVAEPKTRKPIRTERVYYPEKEHINRILPLQTMLWMSFENRTIICQHPAFFFFYLKLEIGSPIAKI